MSGQQYDIQANDTASDWGNHGVGAFKVWENSLEELQKIVKAMRPADVERSGKAYKALEGRMQTSLDVIYDQSKKMAEHWGGDAAEAAMKKMQETYTAARELHTTSKQTGDALHLHAGMQRSWQDSMNGWAVNAANSGAATIAAVVTLSPSALAARNQAGSDLMGKLQDQTVQSNTNFPDHIRADMPRTEIQDYNQNPPNTPGTPSTPNVPGGGHMPGGGGPGHLPGGGVLPGGGGGGGSGHLPGGGGGSGHLPGGGGGLGHLPSGGGGTSLAGLHGGGAGGLGGGLGGGAGAGAGGLGGGIPGGGAGAGSMGVGALGAGGLGGGVPGAGALGKNGPGAGGRPGAGGMPMGGGHGGGKGDEEEHERSTWLTEDEDVWGGDGDVTPPVIG
jgi:uncharacterized protein YukE